MKKLGTTKFRSAFLTRRFGKVLFSISFGFLLLEGIARLSPHLIPGLWHQKYGFELYSSPTFVSRQIYNENGARGSLYHGEKYRIAIIGTSSALAEKVDQNQIWSEILRRNLQNTHVDNFSVKGITFSEVLSTIETIANLKIHYDLLIFNLTLDTESSFSKKASYPRYWNKWAEKVHSFSAAFNFLSDSFKHQLLNESRLSQVFEKLKNAFFSQARASETCHPAEDQTQAEDCLLLKNKECRDIYLRERGKSRDFSEDYYNQYMEPCQKEAYLSCNVSILKKEVNADTEKRSVQILRNLLLVIATQGSKVAKNLLFTDVPTVDPSKRNYKDLAMAFGFNFYLKDRCLYTPSPSEVIQEHLTINRHIRTIIEETGFRFFSLHDVVQAQNTPDGELFWGNVYLSPQGHKVSGEALASHIEGLALLNRGTSQ